MHSLVPYGTQLLKNAGPGSGQAVTAVTLLRLEGSDAVQKPLRQANKSLAHRRPVPNNGSIFRLLE